MKRTYLYFILLFSLLCFLNFNKQSKSVLFHYSSELWADKAGYYSFLPAFFIYDFDASKYPEDYADKTGGGFQLDSVNNKVATRYTYGVALLESPFFGVAHLASKLSSNPLTGFTNIYHKTLNVCFGFYGALGMFYLFYFLRFYYDKSTSLISIILLLLGTNLLYYIIDEGAMSHTFSFCIMSIYLYYLYRVLVLKSDKPSYQIFISLCFGLLVLIRPTAIVFCTLSLLLLGKQNVINRIHLLLKSKFVYLIPLSVILFYVPQFIYWKYLSGSWLWYSYENQTFNWLQPQITKVLFEFHNGLLPNSPILIFSVTGAFLYLFNPKFENKWLVITTLIGMVYICSSWWAWDFGCSFGQRPFIDVYPILVLPIAFMVKQVNSNRKLMYAFYPICFIMILVTVKLTYTFDECWFEGDWDFLEYKKLLLK